MKREKMTIDKTNHKRLGGARVDECAATGSATARREDAFSDDREASEDSSRIEFDSPKCESKFRRALRGVPSKTYISRRGVKLILCVRPVNMLEFGWSLNRNGLQHCETANKILRHLDKNKEE